MASCYVFWWPRVQILALTPSTLTKVFAVPLSLSAQKPKTDFHIYVTDSSHIPCDNLLPDHLIIFLLPIALRPFSLALASLIIDANFTLSNAFVLHRFKPSFLKSYPYPYFVCVVIFLNLSGILYISVSQTFFKWGPLSLARMFYGPPYSCPL
jgi:hypothetical protein